MQSKYKHYDFLLKELLNVSFFCIIAMRKLSQDKTNRDSSVVLYSCTRIFSCTVIYCCTALLLHKETKPLKTVMPIIFLDALSTFNIFYNIFHPIVQ